MENYKERIERQEAKDRYIASECLKALLKKGKNLEINPTAITCYVDLRCKVDTLDDKTLDFNVEIKERRKTQEQLEKYPSAELKKDKLKRMISETPKNTKLLYMVLLNESKCLIFDLKRLDWSKVTLKLWRQKRTQFNPNSDYVTIPTYFIPYSLACATCDCSQYFKNYLNTVEYDSMDK